MTYQSRGNEDNPFPNLIGSNVDYSQWQRQTRFRNKSATNRPITASSSRNSSTNTDTDFHFISTSRLSKNTTSGAGGGGDGGANDGGDIGRTGLVGGFETDLFWDLRKECSARCRHGPKQMTKISEIVKKEKKKTKDGVISLLKVQIREKKNSLQESKQRYLQLIRDNIKLKELITTFEHDTHKDVKGLLGSYRKYKDGLSVLSGQHSTDIDAQEQNLQETKLRLETSVQVLKDEVDDLDRWTEEKRQSLKVLLNYKEKEYPEQMEQIKLLKEEIGTLRKEYDDNLLEYADIANGEKLVYETKANSVNDQLKSWCAQEAMDSVDVSVKKLAQQNQLMTKEILIHQDEERKHQKEIEILLQQIRKLKENEKERIGRRKNPERYFQKCLPEDEIDLHIPLQIPLQTSSTF